VGDPFFIPLDYPQMSLQETLLADLKTAMLGRDELKTRVLRSIKAALLEKEVSIRSGGEANLSEEMVLDVLIKATKQRKDSLSQFESAGREDLAKIEREELEIIASYLPQTLSEEELAHEVRLAIEALGARSPADMGKVMGYLTPKLKGRADGSLISQMVRSQLQK
jgi:uncharacterized protein